METYYFLVEIDWRAANHGPLGYADAHGMLRDGDFDRYTRLTLTPEEVATWKSSSALTVSPPGGR